MKMNELTLSERITLDKLNAINLEIESNEAQSLSNVCWGYLNHKFDESLLSEPKVEIKKKLKHINEIAPRIITSGCADIFDYREGKIFIKPPVIKDNVAKVDVAVKYEASIKEIKAEVKIEKKSVLKKDTMSTKLFVDKNPEVMMAEQLTREALEKQEAESKLEKKLASKTKKEKVVMNTLF